MKTKSLGMKQLFAIAMLLFSVNALAIDTDGDGVDDVGGTVLYSTSFDTAGTWSYGTWTRTSTTPANARTQPWYVTTGSCFGLGCYNPFTMTFTYSVTQPSYISFWAKSNTAGSTALPFFVDNVSAGTFSFNRYGYTEAKALVSVGSHTFKWSVTPGSNGPFYVDDVSIVTTPDNCPSVANANQLNTDGDAAGDACDTDDDNDSVLDASDNCPVNVNANQLNTDGDAQGNVCDSDDDNDGVTDIQEAVLETDPLLVDTDGDTVNDNTDNCPRASNVSQADSDGNGRGDACRGGERDGTFVSAVHIAYDSLPPNAPNGSIRSSAVQADGKIIVAGRFMDGVAIGAYTLARLNVDGSWDSTFTPISTGGGLVDRIAILPDGKILIMGTFSAINGTLRYGITRLNPNGSLDTAFNSGGTGPTISSSPGYVYSMAVQPDGKIVIAGIFNSFNGVPRGNITRLNADGSLDVTFNPGVGVEDVVKDIVIQPDGKILIGGNFYHYDNVVRSYLARLNSDGSLDNSFDSTWGITDDVEAIALQPDGKAIIGGVFFVNGGYGRKGVARVNTDGSLDTTFNPSDASLPSACYDLLLQPDGKILIAGVASFGYRGIDRLNNDGTRDASFSAGIGVGDSPAYVYSLVPQANGEIIMAGKITSYNGVSTVYVARIHSGDADADGIEDAADIDRDNDGVPDVSDAFPLDAYASVDTDGDGMPDWIMGGFENFEVGLPDFDWSLFLASLTSSQKYSGTRSLTFIGYSNASISRHTGPAISFWYRSAFGGFYVDGVNVVNYLSPSATWQQTIVAVTPGLHTLEWRLHGGYIDDVDFGATSPTLVEDSDDDNDGMPDVWEIKYGLNPLVNDANGDLDGDDFANLREYINGTYPTVVNTKIKNDFGGDRKADLLLRNTSTGDWNLASLNGLTVLNQSTVGAFSDIENEMVSAGDFDGDGDADILTRGTDDGLLPGTFHIDLTNGATVTGSAWLFAMSTDTSDVVMSTKDFNKDGKADVLLRNSATGLWTINYMNGTSDPTIGILNASTDLCYTMKGDGDYDGNGYPDLLLRKDNCGGASYPWLVYTTDGDTTILASGTAAGVSMNTGWGAVVTDKDFNGDGKADILMRALSGSVQQWLLFDMNGAGAPSASGLLNIPVQSVWQFASEVDLNGNGKADVLLRSTDTGQWYADLLNGRTILNSGTVNLAMNPVWSLQGINDNNGDGRDDILLRNSATGQWYLNLMNGLTVQSSSSLLITSDLNYVLQND